MIYFYNIVETLLGLNDEMLDPSMYLTFNKMVKKNCTSLQRGGVSIFKSIQWQRKFLMKLKFYNFPEESLLNDVMSFFERDKLTTVKVKQK